MDIIIRGIPRNEVEQVIDEIREANPHRDSLLSHLKNCLINEVIRADEQERKAMADASRAELLNAGFKAHYAVDPSDGVHELEARAKYLSQCVKVVYESLTEMVEMVQRLHDNVCSSSESTRA